jgi:hypothetical protein
MPTQQKKTHVKLNNIRDLATHADKVWNAHDFFTCMDVSLVANFNSTEPKFLLVQVKFNSFKTISHYYNNRFAFHMHTFTISTFILNTLNTAIH